jgi:hypothetical protein
MLKLDLINKTLFNKTLLNICEDYTYNNNIIISIKPTNNIYILFKKVLNFLNFFFKNISIKIYFKLFINNNFLYSSIFNNKIDNSIKNNIYILNNKSTKTYDNNNNINVHSKHKFGSILIRNKIIVNAFEAIENNFLAFKKMNLFKFFNKNILLKKYIYNKNVSKNHKNFIDININEIFKSRFKNLYANKQKISLKNKIIYITNIQRKKFLINNKSFFKFDKTALYYKDLAEYKKLLNRNKNKIRKVIKKNIKNKTL